ncbi:hypothetical protein GQ457_15G021620 [Hibiscus cannabinus]
MANIDVAAMKKQLDTLQGNMDQQMEGTIIPKWWTKEKQDMEKRFDALEMSNKENKNYLEKIFKWCSKEEQEPEQEETGNIQQTVEPVINVTPQKNEGKKPMQVVIVDEQGKYSPKPEGLGVLASKPNMNNHASSSQQKLKIGTETLRGLESLVEKDPYLFEKKVAAMYLIGKAESWFDGYIMQKHKATWHEFAADLCHRFCDKTFTDIIEEFNKLSQKSTVEEYQEKFEELKPFMIQQNASLDENYFVSSFISGLKEELKHRVKAHRPKTVDEAYRLAKLNELAIEYDIKRQRSFSKPTTYQNSSLAIRNYSVPGPTLRKSNNSSLTQNKQALLDYRRTHDLCFKCGEKFSPGHKCNAKQLNLMEEVEQAVEHEEMAELGDQEVLPEKEVEEGNLEISMNALTGNTGYSTLRIQGSIKGRPLNILVVSGSTHSFITTVWAREGVELVKTDPLTITVANGEKLFSLAKSNQLVWKMQGYQFEHDFRVLQLGGCDMVLGVDWMKKYSPVMMDFNEMTLSFQHGPQYITLHGGKKLPSVKLISGDKLQKWAERDSELMGEIYLMSVDVTTTEIPEQLQPILEKYQQVFEEPKGMPPTRNHDHSIVLKPGTQPVNLRPYRFPHYQKEEVEKQIVEMLSSGIIQTSKSPFASPCLLVKKKDGSWRLCVDYRQLNAATVKNKFPIPVVEDLLDELNGAKFFSKIDLRKFVLVFFDDILVYNKTMDQHVLHLQSVLDVLQNNKLFAKKSKCFFGQQQVEYLGHLISFQGVATDPTKVEAMKDWPLPKNLKSLRGFLGLTGYYRKFIRHYGEISKPLTNMLRKDGFTWTIEAKDAFDQLKEMMWSKLRSLSYLDAKRIWGDVDVDFRISPAEGRSGGLLVLWDKKKFTISSIICERRFIALRGKWINLDMEASMVNVYAPNTEGDQLLCWEELISLRREWNSGWIVGGDFNTVTSRSERSGCKFPSKGMSEFVNFITDCGLVDLPLVGKKVTWFGDDNKRNRLDRFFGG